MGRFEELAARAPAGDLSRAEAEELGRLLAAAPPAGGAAFTGAPAPVRRRLRGGGALALGAAALIALAAAGLRARRRPAPAAPPLPAPVVLASFDFEDGVTPPAMREGHVTAGPPRPGSRFAAAGTLNLLSPLQNPSKVTLDARPLFRYAPGTVVAFAYWLPPDAQHLKVQMWDRTRRELFYTVLRDVARGAWARAELRVEDLAPDKDPTARPGDGDEFSNLSIMGGRFAGEPIYVDDVRILRP